MKEKSLVTGLVFDPDDMVYFRNIEQSVMYMFWGATLYDLFRDNEEKLVFCFSREDHKRLSPLWRNKKYNGDLNG